MDYNISISRRAKRISITVKRDGSCVVSVPFRRSTILQKLLLVKAKGFAVTKKEWIETQREKYKKLQEKIKKIRGEYGGNGPTSNDEEFGADAGSQKNISPKELKVRTMNIVTERLAHFNTFYNFQYKDVRVKKVSSRWGSCSRRGNLNFSHKLVLLRPEEIDYVVVHELCHLREFNHGPKFWKLVEQTIPNYKQIRKGMRFAIF